MDESDIEEDLNLGRISEESAYRYTVHTVTHLQSQHPNATLQVGSNLDFLPVVARTGPFVNGECLSVHAVRLLSRTARPVDC